MTATLHADLETRWTPSQEQIWTAKKLLNAYGNSRVVVLVPIALSNKEYGWWTDKVEVDHIEGVYVIAYGSEPVDGAVDYAMGREIVERIAKVNSKNGTGSYAAIRPDGTYGVYEI